MFNDQHGLTRAVLKGRKTMTRRAIKLKDYDVEYLETAFDWDLRESVIIDRYARYKVGDIVAVAQPYKNALHPLDWVNREIYKKSKGWTNKMFVRADLMPHQIEITNIKVERLQDISDDDCLREGVTNIGSLEGDAYVPYITCPQLFDTPVEAFKVLIDKVTGKGTWKRNPWVFVYTFELVK